MTEPVADPVRPVPQPPPATGQGDRQQTFTQEDVERVVGERLARERAKFRDYDDLKTKADQFEKIEAANASDLEKATKKAADEARAAMTETTNTRLVRAEVKAAAAAASFYDPGDAAALLSAQFKSVKVDEHGDVDEAAVKALVEELAKAKPHLVKATNGAARPLPGQGTPPSGSVSGKDAGLAEARKRFGAPKQTT